jgi:hypothetical protein
MNNSSGVGVLDKTVSVLSALESGPASLAQLVKATGLARPTAHRIAVALETHRMLARDAQGRFVLGPRIGELAAAAGRGPAAGHRPAHLDPAQGRHRGERPALPAARGHQDLRRRGRTDQRPAGHGPGRRRAADDGRLGRAGPARLGGRRPDAPRACAAPSSARPRWPRCAGAAGPATAAEREPGVASVSAPVRGPGGRVLAAVSVSGPIERLTRSPGRMHAPAVVAAGDRISKLLRAET